MTTQNRRTIMPITEAVYPRKKRQDDSTPEERLAEHRASYAKPEPTSARHVFRITGSAKAALGQLITYRGGEPVFKGSQKRRRPRRKAVTA